MKYEVTKPCTQDWNKMKPLEGGRFCELCSKKVHDLTNGQHLPNRGETFCGRINVPVTKQISFMNFLWKQRSLRYLLLFCVLLFSNKIKAQLSKTNLKNIDFYRDTMDSSGKMVRIDGVLENGKTGETVAFAYITLLDSQKNVLDIVQTGLDGEFTFFFLPENAGDSLVSIRAEYIGMETLEVINIPVVKKEMRVKLHLEREVTYLGMVGMIMKSSTTFDSGYRHTPNKDIKAVAEIIANSPMIGR